MPSKGARSRIAKAERPTGAVGFTATRGSQDSGSEFELDVEADAGYESDEELTQNAFAAITRRKDAIGQADAMSVARRMRGVYTRDSFTTKWRREKEQIALTKSAGGCDKITAYFLKKETPAEPEILPADSSWMDLLYSFDNDETDWQAEVNTVFEEIHANVDKDYTRGDDDEDTFPGEVKNPGPECIMAGPEAYQHTSSPQPMQADQLAGTDVDFLHEDENDEDGEDDLIVIIMKHLKELQKLRATGSTMESLQRLTAVADYVKLRMMLEKNPHSKRPWMNASLRVAKQMGRGPYFARQIRFYAAYLKSHKKLPPCKRGKHGRHASWLDNEAVLQKVKVFLASQETGEVKPEKLRRYIIHDVLPSIAANMGTQGLSLNIALSTIHRWLRKLGYTHHTSKKGVYVDGHERPDVVVSRTKFLEKMEEYEKFMCSYDEKTMEPLPLTLQPGEREHILVVQDESIFHVNDLQREMWLLEGQQPLRQKGNGRSIHVSDFLCEKSATGRLSLSQEELDVQATLPEEKRLPITDCRKMIYPGKNHDKWWDMPQLLTQTRHAVNIFNNLHPGTVGVFLFDCSAAHESFSLDALNVNNMNVNPGGKQSKLYDTIIPLNNPPPKSGKHDTRGQPQLMVFPDDYPSPELAGKAKGLLHVLQERESVWEKFCEENNGRRLVGVCSACKLSQKKRDALAKIAKAEEAGREDDLELTQDVLDSAQEIAPESTSDWCCAKRVLSLQEDFLAEKPMLQIYIESRGHVCMFLPKFHCELNAIELYWGFGKHRYRDTNDGKFGTAQVLVPRCLDLCTTATIRRFFRKCYRYMDSYRKGLDFLEAVKSVKKYKSHRRIPNAVEVRKALQQVKK